MLADQPRKPQGTIGIPPSSSLITVLTFHCHLFSSSRRTVGSQWTDEIGKLLEAEAGRAGSLIRQIEDDVDTVLDHLQGRTCCPRGQLEHVRRL